MPFLLVCVRRRKEVNRFFHTFFGGLVSHSGAGPAALDNCRQFLGLKALKRIKFKMRGRQGRGGK